MRRNDTDYWRAPDMRPKTWPFELVSVSRSVLDDVATAMKPRIERLTRASNFHKVADAADMLALHDVLTRHERLRALRELDRRDLSASKCELAVNLAEKAELIAGEL